ncbi:MAG: hypothetical protein GX224_03310 [Thermoplasmatales archaeon]|nr:hypothetical protein [Thermoplasmatales archaeon]
MVNTKTIAIIAGVIILVAGMGAAFYLIQGEGEIIDVPPTGSELTIYGNANGDKTIDSNDVRIVERVLNNEDGYTLENYPLADANNNGEIDEEDLTIVKALAAREPTKCFVIAQLDYERDDAEYAVVEIKYPLKHVVSINAEVTTVLVNLGVASSVAGYQASEYSNLDLKPLKDANSKALDLTSSRQVRIKSYQEIIQLDDDHESDGGVGAIFIYNTSALGDYKSDFKTAGIPVIHTKCTNPVPSIIGYRTFGFLFGTAGESQGNAIATFITDVMDEVDDRLASNNITEENKVNALVLFQSTNIAGSNSQYVYAVNEAGGTVINQQAGASTRLTGSESILTFKNPKPDYIISFTTQGLVKLSDETIVGTVWDIKNLSYLSSSPAYENLVYVNASLSVPARIAYVAQTLYPVIFEGYGDEVWKNYVDQFMPFLNEAMSDGDYDVKLDFTATISYDDYKTAGGTN